MRRFGSVVWGLGLGFRVFPGVAIKSASPFCSTVLYDWNSYMCDVRMVVLIFDLVRLE